MIIVERNMKAKYRRIDINCHQQKSTLIRLVLFHFGIIFNWSKSETLNLIEFNLSPKNKDAKKSLKSRPINLN